MEQEEKEIWFAMRVTYRRELKAQAELKAQGVSSFIPMQYRYFPQRRKKRVLVPCIHSLLFVHSNPSRLQAIKNAGRMPYLQYMMDQRSGRKITVPDREMEQFIAVSGDYDELLLYFKPGELNLHRGCRVRINAGQFRGYEGIYMRVKGARDKRVVIGIPGVLHIALCTLPPELIDILPETGEKTDTIQERHDHSR